MGFVLPSVFVSGKGKADITLLMLVEAIIISVAAVLVLVLFQSKPRVPPSASAGEERERFTAAVRLLLRNRPYKTLLFAFSMGMGTFNALATMIQQLVSPYGFSSVPSMQFDVSLFGALIILSGLIGSGVVSVVVAKTRAYKVTIAVMFTTSVVMGLVFVFTLWAKSLPITAIVVFVFGFIMTPVLPVSYELGCEVTFPIGEAMSGGLLNTGGQIMGIVQVGIIAALAEYVSVFVANLQMVFFLLLGAVGAFLVKQDLVRTKEDEKRTGLTMSP